MLPLVPASKQLFAAASKSLVFCPVTLPFPVLRRCAQLPQRACFAVGFECAVRGRGLAALREAEVEEGEAGRYKSSQPF